MKRTVTTVEIVERVVVSAAHTDTVRPLPGLPILLEMLQRTPPVNWWRWDTPTCVTMPKVSRIGLTPGYQLRVNTIIGQPILVQRAFSVTISLMMQLVARFS